MFPKHLYAKNLYETCFQFNNVNNIFLNFIKILMISIKLQANHFRKIKIKLQKHFLTLFQYNVSKCFNIMYAKNIYETCLQTLLLTSFNIFLFIYIVSVAFLMNDFLKLQHLWEIKIFESNYRHLFENIKCSCFRNIFVR